MAKAGIVPDCAACDVENDGSEDGHCCAVIFCEIHLAAASAYRRLRTETTIQARLARRYRADARDLKKTGLFEAYSAAERIGATYRETFVRLLEIVKLSAPKRQAVMA